MFSWRLAAGRLAGAALTIVVTTPPVTAQSDRPVAVRPQAAGAAATSRRGGGSSVDLIEMRDAIAHSMFMASTTASGQPLATNEVVCIAGCDRGPGSVVYRSQTAPTLATMSAPTLAPATTQVASNQAQPRLGALNCIAGCYEPPKVRTVASLRNDALARASVARVAARPRPIKIEQPAAVADAMPATATLAANAPVIAGEPVVQLRAAVTPNGPTQAARTAGSKPRSRTVAKKKHRGLHYGKRMAVPTPTSTSIAATPARQPSSDANEPTARTDTLAVEAPVTKFAPTRRPERRRPDHGAPHAAVSNDWFNKINRERREKAALEKAASPSSDNN